MLPEYVSGQYPGSVDDRTVDQQLQPSLFEFDEPHVDNPKIYLKSGWYGIGSLAELSFTGGSAINGSGGDIVLSSNLDVVGSFKKGSEIVDRTITKVSDITNASNTTQTLPTSVNNEPSRCFLRTGSGSGKLIINTQTGEKIKYDGQEVETIEFDDIPEAGITLSPFGGDWIVQNTIGCELGYYGSALEVIYTKRLIGNLDSDAATNIAHGISDYTKITEAYVAAGTGSQFNLYSYGTSPSDAYLTNYNATNFNFYEVSSDYHGDPYRIVFKYYK